MELKTENERLQHDNASMSANFNRKLDAQEDLRAAIRFVRSKAEEYNLDSDKVIAAGDSAGGITSLFTAYVEEA